jgi:hypothetical protein
MLVKREIEIELFSLLDESRQKLNIVFIIIKDI